MYDLQKRFVRGVYESGSNTVMTSYTYNSFGKVWKMTLVNAKGESFTAVVDRAGSFEKAYYQYDSSTAQQTLFEKYYDAFGNLTRLSDKVSGEIVTISYDTTGAPTTYQSVCGSRTQTETITYTARGNVAKIVYEGGVERTEIYDYLNKGNVQYHGVRAENEFSSSVEYDKYGRLVEKTTGIADGGSLYETVEYTKVNNYSTTLVKNLFSNEMKLAYTYDTMGNIKTVTKSLNGSSFTTKYTYDGFNRLVREDNQALGQTTAYTYDSYGNLVYKKSYAYTTGTLPETATEIKQYSYTADKLTTFGDETLTYDAVGNPTSYRGKHLIWTRGRKLTAFDTTTFGYDGQGKRIRKNSTTYYYDSQGRLLADSNGLQYYYDESGVYGFKYGAVRYLYRKNLQGDIIGILDSSGATVVQYEYDAWGNHKVYNASGVENTNASFIGNINPFRYRGYYYDTETGLYYLQTRYYDPVTGRFLNMDNVSYADPATLNGLNLYAYCGNNPVMYVDPSGNWNWHVFWKGVGMVMTAVTAVALSVATFGAGVPVAISIVAGVTLGAGVLTGVNGIATLIEAGTDYNFVRDGIFQGDEEAYNLYAGITDGVAVMGSMVLGGYHSTGQYQASKYGQNFLGKGYKKIPGKNRWVSQDGLRQMIFDDSHHILDGIKTTNHFNLYTHSKNMLKESSPITNKLHVFYDFFNIWFK